MSFGWAQLHFVYSWNRTNRSPNLPDYICYDERYCSFPEIDIRFVKTSDPSVVLSCQFSNITNLRGDWFTQSKLLRQYMHSRCSLGIAIKEMNCLEQSQFQCDNKCFSKYRLVNNLRDCDDGSDELYNNSCSLNDQHRLRCTSHITGVEKTKCIIKTSILAGQQNDCKSDVKLPHFPTICNGYIDYSEKHGTLTQTDETDCEEWQCDNQYTRCDGVWNCRDGADEAKCFHPICHGIRGHPCLLIDTLEFKCLLFSQANDGIVDCLGATDEQHICRTFWERRSGYRCSPNSSHSIQFGNQ